MAVGMVMMTKSVVSLFLNSALASSIRAWQINSSGTELSRMMSKFYVGRSADIAGVSTLVLMGNYQAAATTALLGQHGQAAAAHAALNHDHILHSRL